MIGLSTDNMHNMHINLIKENDAKLTETTQKGYRTFVKTIKDACREEPHLNIRHVAQDDTIRPIIAGLSQEKSENE